MASGGAPGHVTLSIVLVTLAIGQTLFLLLLALLLFSHRNRMWRRRMSTERAREATELPVRQWLSRGGSAADLRAALHGLPPGDAVAQLLEIADRVPTSELGVLADALRDEPWVEAGLERSTSRAWWRRLEAARLLSVAGTVRDKARLHALLRDRHSAVQAVAAAAIPRLGGADEVAIVLDALPVQSLFVQRAQYPLLAEVWGTSGALLCERLDRPGAHPAELVAWIPLAEALGTPELLVAAMQYHAHVDPEVRVAVARALRKYYHPSAMACLRVMLLDQDWRVRAKAAQSLGTVGGVAAVDDLVRALPDAFWWVRFRTALALAQLGEPGREALRTARSSSDRFVAEMASNIAGLTPGGVVELNEG